MHRLLHKLVALPLASAIVFAICVCGQARIAQSRSPILAPQTGSNPTVVTLRWASRPGVNRYRLQLAIDSGFVDIVFDRVVSGNQYQIHELPAGRYYWRVAPLTARLGEFSSAGVVDIPAASSQSVATSEPATGPSTTFKLGAGWQTALGNIAQIGLAHLRSPTSSDVIAVNDEGIFFALNASDGVVLWSVRSSGQVRKSNSAIKYPSPFVTVRSPAGLDNIVLFSQMSAMMLEGRTGRQIWRRSLPRVVSSATSIKDNNTDYIFVIDNSLQNFFVLNASDGSVSSQVHLPKRAVGGASPVDYQATRGVMIALEDGALEILDHSGKLIRSGDAGSAATTAPLFIRTASGGYILVGTKSGLTALNADDLHPLGRVNINEDYPRGDLLAKDLDGDGVAEAIMFTERGRVIVVKSTDGKIVWETDARRAQTAAFLDVNGDGVLDLIITGKEAFASALSGRDGAVLWEEKSPAAFAANHSASLERRFVLVAPGMSGALLIAPDQFHTGLRALEFERLTAPRY